MNRAGAGTLWQQNKPSEATKGDAVVAQEPL
jgi:hypothetical protein